MRLVQFVFEYFIFRKLDFTKIRIEVKRKKEEFVTAFYTLFQMVNIKANRTCFDVYTMRVTHVYPQHSSEHKKKTYRKNHIRFQSECR